jgi:hypothetical protein
MGEASRRRYASSRPWSPSNTPLHRFRASVPLRDPQRARPSVGPRIKAPQTFGALLPARAAEKRTARSGLQGGRPPRDPDPGGRSRPRNPGHPAVLVRWRQDSGNPSRSTTLPRRTTNSRRASLRSAGPSPACQNPCQQQALPLLLNCYLWMTQLQRRSSLHGTDPFSSCLLVHFPLAGRNGGGWARRCVYTCANACRGGGIQCIRVFAGWQRQQRRKTPWMAATATLQNHGAACVPCTPALAVLSPGDRQGFGTRECGGEKGNVSSPASGARSSNQPSNGSGPPSPGPNSENRSPVGCGLPKAPPGALRPSAEGRPRAGLVFLHGRPSPGHCRSIAGPQVLVGPSRDTLQGPRSLWVHPEIHCRAPGPRLLQGCVPTPISADRVRIHNLRCNRR